MFTALRDLFYNLFPINLPGIWWILSERWFLQTGTQSLQKGSVSCLEMLPFLISLSRGIPADRPPWRPPD